MDQKQKGAIAVAVAAGLGGVQAADAATYTATLNQVLTYSNNGTAGTAANISSSNTIFSYDDVSNLVTQGTGLLNIRLTTSPSTTLYRTSITGLVVGNGGAASASTYVCTEGNFAGTSNASICGNYSFGGNFTNDSTLTYGPGTSVTRTLGGDDVSIGTAQSIAGYNGFTTVSFTGTELILSNASCSPLGAAGLANCTIPGALNTGIRLRFATVIDNVIPVPAAAWLFGSALGLLGVARRKLAK